MEWKVLVEFVSWKYASYTSVLTRKRYYSLKEYSFREVLYPFMLINAHYINRISNFQIFHFKWSYNKRNTANWIKLML